MTTPDWGADDRKDEYEFCLVNPYTLQETGDTIDVRYGESSIQWVDGSSNGYTCSLASLRSTNNNRLVRVKQTITIPGYEPVQTTLGTFFIDDTPLTCKYGSVCGDMKGYSTLWRHSQDKMRLDFTGNVGDNVVDEIRRLVEADGGQMLVGADVDTSRTHSKYICFPIGSNKQETLFTIADWINCKISPDPDGYLVLESLFSNHTVQHEFVEGANGTMLEGVDISDTSADAYNRVVAHFEREKRPQHAVKYIDENGDEKYAKDEEGNRIYEDDDDFPLSVNLCIDLPDDHPFSYRNIAYHRTYEIKIGEACYESEVEERAQKWLDENCGCSRYFEIQHPSIPGLTSGQTVRYINNSDYSETINALCIIDQMDMTLGDGGICQTKLREVSS